MGHILSVIGERAVPSLPGWACAINLHLQGKEHRLSAEHVDQITVSDVPARISEYHLVIKPYVIHYLTVEVVRDGAGLTLSLESTTGNDDEDRRILDSILDSLALDT